MTKTVPAFESIGSRPSVPDSLPYEDVWNSWFEWCGPDCFVKLKDHCVQCHDLKNPRLRDAQR